MQPVASEIYALMERWAEAAAVREDFGRGYGESPLGRMGLPALQGLMSKVPPGFSDMADAFALIDLAIVRMNVLLSCAVREHYLGRGTAAQKARRLGISDRTLRRRVHEALVLVQVAWMLGEVDFDHRFARDAA